MGREGTIIVMLLFAIYILYRYRKWSKNENNKKGTR